MSRTKRRKNQFHEYDWVLKNWQYFALGGQYSRHEPKSRLAKKAIALFHSDKEVTMGGAAPRWYRKSFDHRRRTRNNRAMKNWLCKPEVDPLFEASHKHDANYSWW
ncbi:hypothetical protein [Polynucleobacter antarcticus]|uniref:Uncharacterized protein n=1 Tax=Polynucleobacter antarcticus TaxID=1743162 RepID=A0A6M9PPE9_9BURK|nr:hypothetical protein [Polynucleobacter antarcticus]QKM62291.1 hypothetical protein DCO16_03920 [Polynucleobacter antarcticus]